MTGLDRINDKQLPMFPWVRSEPRGGPQRYHVLVGGCVSGRAANGQGFWSNRDVASGSLMQSKTPCSLSHGFLICETQE